MYRVTSRTTRRNAHHAAALRTAPLRPLVATRRQDGVKTLPREHRHLHVRECDRRGRVAEGGEPDDHVVPKAAILWCEQPAAPSDTPALDQGKRAHVQSRVGRVERTFHREGHVGEEVRLDSVPEVGHLREQWPSGSVRHVDEAVAESRPSIVSCPAACDNANDEAK